MPRALANPSLLISSDHSRFFSSSASQALPLQLHQQQALHLSSSSRLGYGFQPQQQEQQEQTAAVMGKDEDSSADPSNGRFSESLALERLTASALDTAMIIHRERGRIDEALRVWDDFRAMRLLPSFISYCIAVSLFQSKKDAKRALRAYRDARQQFLGVDSTGIIDIGGPRRAVLFDSPDEEIVAEVGAFSQADAGIGHLHAQENGAFSQADSIAEEAAAFSQERADIGALLPDEQEIGAFPLVNESASQELGALSQEDEPMSQENGVDESMAQELGAFLQADESTSQENGVLSQAGESISQGVGAFSQAAESISSKCPAFSHTQAEVGAFSQADESTSQELGQFSQADESVAQEPGGFLQVDEMIPSESRAFSDDEAEIGQSDDPATGFSQERQTFGAFSKPDRETGAFAAESTSNPETAAAIEKLGSAVLSLCLDQLHRGLATNANRYAMQSLFLKMQYARLHIPASDCTRLLLLCGVHPNDRAILRPIYIYILNRHRRILTPDLSNHAIRVLGFQRRFWSALSVYETMPQEHRNNETFALLRSHFAALIAAGKRKNQWKWCLRLLQKMEEHRIRPGKSSWDAAITACARSGRVDESVALFQRMIHWRYKPDIRSYSALLSALEKKALVEEMERVVASMRKSGVRLTESVYTTLISAHGKNGFGGFGCGGGFGLGDEEERG